MNHAESLTSTVNYGRKLVNAGIAGIRAGQESGLAGRSLSELAAGSARGSLKLAAAGACLALLPACFPRRRRHFGTALAMGALGGTLGFFAAFSWKTRKVTSSLAQSALKQIHKVSDEHWLQGHPIDYA